MNPKNIAKILVLRLGLHHVFYSWTRPTMIRGYKDPRTGDFFKRVRISSSTVLYRPERIRFSDNVYVGHHCILDGTGYLTIGKGTQVAALTGIYTHSSHSAIRLYGERYTTVPESEKVAFHLGEVTIGEYVYIGSGAKILPGITIGDYALVAAGAIVTKDVKSCEMVVGNPARVVGDVREKDRQWLDMYPDLRKHYVVPDTNSQ